MTNRLKSGIEIGPYPAGDVPQSLDYTYTDADGVAIDLTAWTVTFKWRRQAVGVTETSRAGSIVAPGTNGTVRHAWADADLDVAGYYEGEFVATEGTYELTSVRLGWYVGPAI